MVTSVRAPVSLVVSHSSTWFSGSGASRCFPSGRRLRVTALTATRNRTEVPVVIAVPQCTVLTFAVGGAWVGAIRDWTRTTLPVAVSSTRNRIRDAARRSCSATGRSTVVAWVVMRSVLTAGGTPLVGTARSRSARLSSEVPRWYGNAGG